VTSVSPPYTYEIEISSDLLIRARVFNGSSYSDEAFFNYDVVGGLIYFNSLSVYSYDLAYEKNQPFTFDSRKVSRLLNFLIIRSFAKILSGT